MTDSRDQSFSDRRAFFEQQQNSASSSNVSKPEVKGESVKAVKKLIEKFPGKNLLTKEMSSISASTTDEELNTTTKLKPPQRKASFDLSFLNQSNASSSSSQDASRLAEEFKAQGVNVQERTKQIQMLLEIVKVFKAKSIDKYVKASASKRQDKDPEVIQQINECLVKVQGSVMHDYEQVINKQITLPDQMTMTQFVELAFIYRCCEKAYTIIIDVQMSICRHLEREDATKIYTLAELNIFQETAISVNWIDEYHEKIKDFEQISDWAKNIRMLNVKQWYATEANEKWVAYQAKYQDYINGDGKANHPANGKVVKKLPTHSASSTPIDEKIKNEILDKVAQDMQSAQSEGQIKPPIKPRM